MAELTDCIASSLDYPVPTARLIARLGREHEILTHGGRGRSVPKATSADAANLLIAFMVCPTPARAPDYMRDFGSLLLMPSMMDFDEGAGPTVRHAFQPRMTFRDAVGAALDLLGSAEFAAEFNLKEHVGDERPGDDSAVAPVIDVTIIDTYLQAELAIDGSHFFFLHPSLLTAETLILSEQAAGSKSDEAHERIAEAAIAANRYVSPIRSTRTVEVGPLLPVAELLHGRSFVSLLNERFDREAVHA
ncbi:hypothetical protein EN933_02305 [Mesorhizobium sp. M7A.F.Ca.US.001.01.1.1]|nr:hypothetical protein EN933_02305 [Mesorhizobium sp. M7A.F.Ca.US.001.01.1.1]